MRLEYSTLPLGTRDARASLIQGAKDILEQKRVSQRDQKMFDLLMANADSMSRQIEAAEARNAAAAPEVNTDQYGSAFRSFLRNGSSPNLCGRGVTEEERSILEKGETRDMGTGGGNALQGTGGGYFVPAQFESQVESAAKYYGPMLSASTAIDTTTGGNLAYPSDNDVAAVGEMITENSQFSTGDVPLGSQVFKDYMFSSKIVKCSLALVQDSAFNLEAYLAGRFGIRIGRALNTKFTAGAGTTEPQGILTAATSSGITAAGSSANTGGAETGATSIGSDDLTALEHSVDPLYRIGASYMMHDNTLKVIQQVKDKQGRPLFPNLPRTLNGYPVLVNNDMTPIATTVKSVLFGAIYKYAVRNAGGMTILRLNERFADFGQVGFICLARRDGQLLDAGTHPVKYLTQA